MNKPTAPVSYRPSFPDVRLPQLAEVTLPKVQHARLTHPRGTPITDLDGLVTGGLGASKRLNALPKGAKVAIAVGSRGVARIGEVVRAAVGWCKAQGLEPFIVPAMGSHGGAIAEGQAQLLRDLGVREEFIGAPIRATMETVEYGQTKHGIPCRFDKFASEADAVICINRVKTHTSFDRPVESGLVKLIAVGLGKAEGARNVHKLGVLGLSEVLPDLSRIALANAPIAYGIAVVENAMKELVAVEGVEPEAFFETDARLLEVAKSLLGRLPFHEIDVLVCEMMGKNISGAGMDYAVHGRADIRGVPNRETPVVGMLAVLELTPESHGNCAGLGVADYIPKSLAEDIDLFAFYMNAVTSTFVNKASVPCVLPDEESVFRCSVLTSGLSREQEGNAKLCVIRSTLHLHDILASPSLLATVKGDPRVEVLSEPMPLAFSPEGRLLTRCPV